MLKNIVVGVDGSPSGRRALEWAVDAAAHEVHAVHAVSPGLELLAAGFQINTRPLIERLTTQLECVWAAGMKTDRTKIFTHVVENSPVRALLEIAGACNADAIAVGERGQNSAPSKMVGATTSRLTHLSDVPIVVVPSIARVGGDDDPQVIVIGVTDHPLEDAELVSWACAAARDTSTQIDLVNSDSRVSPGSRQANTTAAARGATATTRIDAWLVRQRYPNPCRFVVAAGDPITALVDASQHASLIVVGSHRSSRLAAYLTGALANHLPAISSCPVAIVPLTAARP